MDTATATIPSARLKKADNALMRTAQENSGTPKGRLQVRFAPWVRARKADTVSKRAPASASEKAPTRARSRLPKPARLATAPARYAIDRGLLIRRSG